MSETKKFYRVCHEDTMQGLWYNSRGEFTGLIHNKYDYLKNSSLEMPFDEELVGWLSAVGSLEDLYYWFPSEDIKSLQNDGFYIYEYLTEDYKFYDRFKHIVINQDTSILTKKIILL